jgi:hypothetical protein
MGVVTSDTFLFGMVLFDVLLRDGLLRSGKVDGVAFSAELPRIGLNQLLRFGIFDVFVRSAMATLAGQIAMVALALHGNDGVVATHAALVSDIMDG